MLWGAEWCWRQRVPGGASRRFSFSGRRTWTRPAFPSPGSRAATIWDLASSGLRSWLRWRRHSVSYARISHLLGGLALPSTVSETAFLAALVAHMDAAGPAALVLDEFHHAPSTSVALLAKVIDAAGADLRFLVGTRWDPVFPVGRWQAQGRLQQLRGPDLA